MFFFLYPFYHPVTIIPILGREPLIQKENKNSSSLLQFGLTVFLCPSVPACVSDVWDDEAPLCYPAHQHEKEGGQGRALRAEGVRKLNSDTIL